VELVLATQNPKKVAELRAMLAGQELVVLTPAEVGGLPDVPEDAPTFRENAARKARSAALASGRWALADDSGLEVEALGGEPGVRSARWASDQGASGPADDEANNRLLLARLAGVPEERRSARFVCALALARPDGRVVLEVEGEARGRILGGRRGERDFGYDPCFLFTEEGFPQTGRGFAELEPEEKARVSHRGRALRELVRRLPEALGREREAS
jgi:XTP/dITP diphosphohydrolase